MFSLSNIMWYILKWFYHVGVCLLLLVAILALCNDVSVQAVFVVLPVIAGYVLAY